jgi:hypothetical protein
LLEQFFSVAVDPTASSTVYVGTHFDGVYKTVDGGASWAQLDSGDYPLLIGALVVDPSNPAIVYAAGFGGVARSTTGGGSWSFVNNGLSPLVFALAIDPSAPGTLYAGTDPATGPFTGVYKTTNGGAVWSPVNTGLPAVAGTAVQALAVDKAAPATVYVALENLGIYKTTNAGASWAAVNDGLAAVDVKSLAVDEVLPDTVYAGTAGGGVFTSTNGGASWLPANVGLHNQYVRALAVESGRVYAGTAGDGAFVAETATSPPQPIRGKTLVIQNPNSDDAAKRKITVVASESGSAATLDLETLLANGATFTISARGEVSRSQSFWLPPPWARVGTTGARYLDRTGANGPVKSVDVVKTASGVMKLKATILGKLGPGPQPHVVVVPPDPGNEGQVRLQVEGGATYCVGFGGAAGGTVVNQGAALFRVANPTTAVCP